MPNLISMLRFVLLVVFTIGAWWNLRELIAARHWEPVVCQIERSETEREPHAAGDHFIFQVRYLYTFAGQSFASDRYAFSTNGRFGTPEKSDALVRRWPAGSETTCWVDPQNPAEAVLDRTEGWEAGMVMLVIAILPLLLHWLDSSPASVRPASWRSAAWKEFGFAVVLAAIIMPTFLGLSLAPVWQSVQARQWTATPCEIVSSRVVYRGHDYEPEIIFTWKHEGEVFRSGQARFTIFSGGLPTMEALVAHYPAGTQRTCFVNPQNPAEAVLDRAYHFDHYIEHLGLAFVVFVLLWVWRAARQLQRGYSIPATSGEVRHGLEFIFPGMSAGTLAWLAVSVLNVLGLFPIAWREWQTGQFPTFYGFLFIGAACSLLVALGVAWLRYVRKVRLLPD
jgi:hypothetical protein